MKSFLFGQRRARPRNRGVTLIELMVVVAIVAILAVAFMAMFRGARAEAIDGRALDYLDQVRRVMALYSSKHGAFPTPTGITNDAANVGAEAYTLLATELQTIESDVPTALADSSVNLQDFTYFPTAGGAFASPNAFTIVARAINGTNSYICADPSRVVNLGATPTPAIPGSRCQ